MKLRELIDRMKPMFTGEATPAETASAIYGDAADSPSGQRLAIYDRVRSERPGELRFAFPVIAQLLGAAFDPLAYEYFKLHPWGAADYRPDGEHFAAFLTDSRPWIAELARLEWAMYSARLTTTRSPESSAVLRLGATARLMTFEHDLVRWLRTAQRPAAPEQRTTNVVVWTRDNGESRFIGLEDHQHAILVAAQQGDLDLAAIPSSLAASEHAVAGFVAAGVLVGPAPEGTELVPTLGSQRSTALTMAPFVQVRWEDGAMQLWSPLCPEVLASEDVELVLVANQFAAARTIGDAVTSLAERMQPADVVEIADALYQAGLLIGADAPPHPAQLAGWDPHEAAAYAMTRDVREVPPVEDPDGARIDAPADLEVLRAIDGVELFVHAGAHCYRYDPIAHELVPLGAARYAQRVVEVGSRVANAFRAGASLLSLHFAAGRAAHVLELAGANAIDIAPTDEPWSLLILGAFEL